MSCDKSAYHTRFSPVTVLPPLVVDVPATRGLSLNANVFEPTFSMCRREGIVDINFLDAVVVRELTKLPGVNPGTFSMFMLYNASMSIGNPTNFGNCCAGGYHGINPVSPIMFQAYSPFDFDTSGFYVPQANDTDIVSHEAGEFLNDPYAVNITPLWRHTGQVAGCQNNLEVGDPLTGQNAPSVVMPNSFTYHQQAGFQISNLRDRPLAGLKLERTGVWRGVAWYRIVKIRMESEGRPANPVKVPVPSYRRYKDEDEEE